MTHATNATTIVATSGVAVLFGESDPYAHNARCHAAERATGVDYSTDLALAGATERLRGASVKMAVHAQRRERCNSSRVAGDKPRPDGTVSGQACSIGGFHSSVSGTAKRIGVHAEKARGIREQGIDRGEQLPVDRVQCASAVHDWSAREYFE